MAQVKRRVPSTSPSQREALELRKLEAEARNLERQTTWVSRLVSFVPLVSVGVAAFAIWDGTTRWQTEKQLERDAAQQARVQREQEREQQLEDAAAQRFREAFARISSASEAERLGALAYVMSRAGSEGSLPLTKEQTRDVVLLVARSIAIEPSAAVRRAEVSAITQLMRFTGDPDVARQALDALIESNRGLYEEHAMYRTGRIVMDATRFHDGPIDPSGPHARAISAGYAMVDIMRLSPQFRPTPLVDISREARAPDNAAFCKVFPGYDFSRIYCPTCDFTMINAPCSSFADAILQLADFSRNDLRASNFDRAEIDGAWFIETDLRRTEFEVDNPWDRSIMQFEGAHHSPALTHLFANTRIENIRSFRWQGPNFRCADLRSAKFGFAGIFPLVSDEFRQKYPDIYLSPPDFQGSNLEDADLTNVMIFYLLMVTEDTIDASKVLGGEFPIQGSEARYIEDFGSSTGSNAATFSRNLDRYTYNFHKSQWQQAQLPPWLDQHLKKSGTQPWPFGVPCEPSARQNDRRARLPPNVIDILKRFDSKYIITRPEPSFVQWLRQSADPPTGDSAAK